MSQLSIDVQLKRDTFQLNAQMALPPHGITALFGPSGAGKTTLLRALAGLEPTEGNISLDSTVWQDGQTFLPAHQRPVGLVFQESSLFPHLNVEKNLLYGYRRTDEHALELDQIIDLLGLGELLSRRPEQLSGGERKRVAIGRALLRSPRVLLLDEPLTSLDIARKRELLPFLERLHRDLQLPVIYVSHAIDEVARLADHLALIDEGTITAVGPVNSILTRLDLPIAHEHDAGAVVEATAQDYDEGFELSTLAFSGGELTVPGRIETGSRLRARVLARDVSLTLERQPDTSILNILPATVAEISADCSAQILVRLEAGTTTLLARITRKSGAALDLAVGKRVFAQIKSIALLDI